MIDIFIVQKVYQVCIMSTITLKSPYQVNTGTGYPPPSLRRKLTEAYADASYSLNDSLTLVTHPAPCPTSPICSPWPAASWPCSPFQYWSSLKPTQPPPIHQNDSLYAATQSCTVNLRSVDQTTHWAFIKRKWLFACFQNNRALSFCDNMFYWCYSIWYLKLSCITTWYTFMCFTGIPWMYVPFW